MYGCNSTEERLIYKRDLTPSILSAELFLCKPWISKGFFQFEIIMNVFKLLLSIIFEYLS